MRQANHDKGVPVYEILVSGGWVMIPILLCSLLALGICIERFWTLNPKKIAPPNLLPQVWLWLNKNQLTQERLKQLRSSSPLGDILATGLVNAHHGRAIMKESIESSAAHVVHELERFLNPLGTIAVISPLLGLLGTVLGMIEIFADIMQSGGAGNASVLAGGISQALVTTVAGLIVAIPSVIMHRYFLRRVDSVVVEMERQTIRLIDALHGNRSVKLVDGKDE